MSDPRPHPGEDAPPKLISALKQLAQEPHFIPRTVDEAVIRAARQHLLQAERPRFVWLRFVPWATAAAALLILVFCVHRFSNPASPANPTAFDSADINHDGRIDILDALALAKQLKSGERQAADLNGDGVVDERDVQTIAARAVRLEKGGHS